MSGRTEQLVRIACGAGLTLGLLAFGLELTGSTARARSFLDLEWSGPSLAALEGSSAGRGGEVLVDGVPTRVRTCATAELPSQVFARYQDIAADDSGGRPWVEARTEDGGGFLAWVDRQGLRKSVRVERAPCGTTYDLFEADPLPEDAPQPPQRLPADLPVPAGCEVVFSVVRPDGTGVGFLLTRGPGDGAARRCVEALGAQGFVVDQGAVGALEGRADEGRLTIPFAAPGRRGLLTVAPAELGARLSLAIHPAH